MHPSHNVMQPFEAANVVVHDADAVHLHDEIEQGNEISTSCHSKMVA